jgi:hypothetical protein
MHCGNDADYGPSDSQLEYFSAPYRQLLPLDVCYAAVIFFSFGLWSLISKFKK